MALLILTTVSVTKMQKNCLQSNSILDQSQELRAIVNELSVSEKLYTTLKKKKNEKNEKK